MADPKDRHWSEAAPQPGGADPIPAVQVALPVPETCHSFTVTKASYQRCFFVIVAVKSGPFFTTQSTNLRTFG